jgi:cation:H+ antiporter
MSTPLLLVFLGLILLFFGGEGLVRGSAALALRLGLTPLVVGLTVVAFGTSSPELVVSVKAALDGQGAIAIGNVIGSNCLNIGLILGLTALLSPLTVQLQILRIDAPIMVAVSLLAAWMMSDFLVTSNEGILLSAALILYVIFTVIYAKRSLTSAAVEAEFAEAVPKPSGSIWKDLIFIAAGLALLVVGSRVMVEGAVDLARLLGISEAVIGLTIVAIGTSMPELVTCVIAALKKEADIALGNIIGSSIFNILGILGVSAWLRPLVGDGIHISDPLVAAGFAILLIPMLWSGRKINRFEGVLLLAGYAGYILWLWPK